VRIIVPDFTAHSLHYCAFRVSMLRGTLCFSSIHYLHLLCRSAYFFGQPPPYLGRRAHALLLICLFLLLFLTALPKGSFMATQVLLLAREAAKGEIRIL
jgi:hypothetical protein